MTVKCPECLKDRRVKYVSTLTALCVRCAALLRRKRPTRWQRRTWAQLLASASGVVERLKTLQGPETPRGFAQQLHRLEADLSWLAEEAQVAWLTTEGAR